MSSWWAKDDAGDPTEGRDAGLKTIILRCRKQQKRSQIQNKLDHRWVTQRTQSGRVRGGTMDLAEYGREQKKNGDRKKTR